MSLDDSAHKECKSCGIEKPLLDFPIRSSTPDGHYWLCFDCKRARDREYGRQYRERHPEQKRQSARKYARKDMARQVRSELALKTKYGLTPEAFQEKLAAQGGRCPFCPEGVETTNWDVDHDHACCAGASTCGKCLRDLLCHKHNVGLGYWNDDPEALRQAADYIERWRAAIQPGPTGSRPLGKPPQPRRAPTHLTPQQVDEVRAQYGKPGVTQEWLAKHYGVSQSTISNLLAYGR